MMDILGLPKRMMQQFEQMTHVESTPTIAPKKEPASSDMALSSMGERINYIAREFDVKALEMKDILPLQTALTEYGVIQSHQVRAQGLLTQLAYQHQQTGPMNLEQSLETHLDQLKGKPAVLADYQEGKHVLNVVRNLASARDQQMHAA
ncbi:MAG: hypothetical protein ACI8SR_001463 [Oceanicoccus sp.]|jgi:hypothetical protein